MVSGGNVALAISLGALISRPQYTQTSVAKLIGCPLFVKQLPRQLYLPLPAGSHPGLVCPWVLLLYIIIIDPLAIYLNHRSNILKYN